MDSIYRYCRSRWLSPRLLILILMMAVSVGMSLGAAPRTAGANLTPRVSPELQVQMDAASPGEQVTAIVHLKGQADLDRYRSLPQSERGVRVVRALREASNRSLQKLEALIRSGQADGSIGQVQPLWAVNALIITANPEVITLLASRADVARVSANESYAGPEPLQTPALKGAMPDTPEANLNVVKASSLWDLGYRGQGVVIANMDTGVYMHPDYASRWRGGTNSWYDPYGEHPYTPVDTHGHGTMTMGVMIGGDLGGTSIGIAPEAQWVAVRLYNDQNYATTAAIHQGFQWLLDPDGNPDTDDAPDAVNNSWLMNTAGCDMEYSNDVHVLRMAGILPVFSGGNFGPDPNTGRSPATYIDSFAVTSVANYDMLLSFSSRGPADCGTPPRTYPQVVAPALDIRTTSYQGGYTTITGSSIAAPHVSGGLALLLNAFPDLTPDEQEAALVHSTVDLGDPGPDNDYGYGRIDLLAAYNWLVEQAGGPQPYKVFIPMLNK
jgi:subtilisin family serine protease